MLHIDLLDKQRFLFADFCAVKNYKSQYSAENRHLILRTPTYFISNNKHFSTNLQISSRSLDTAINCETWNCHSGLYEDSGLERRNCRSAIWITTYCYCLCDIMSGDISTQGKNSHPSCIIKDIPQIKLKYKISAVPLKCRETSNKLSVFTQLRLHYTVRNCSDTHRGWHHWDRRGLQSTGRNNTYDELPCHLHLI